jgi:hypothetical protein
MLGEDRAVVAALCIADIADISHIAHIAATGLDEPACPLG